jgi:hypothetical protein
MAENMHDIAEILLKVVLNTKHQIKSHINIYIYIYITPTQQFFSYIMARTSYISMRWWWCLLYSASSLIQQSVSRHVAPLDVLSWFRANQSSLTRWLPGTTKVVLIVSLMLKPTVDQTTPQVTRYYKGSFDCQYYVSFQCIF